MSVFPGNMVFRAIDSIGRFLGTLYRILSKLFAIVKFMAFLAMFIAVLVAVGAIPAECATGAGYAYACVRDWAIFGW